MSHDDLADRTAFSGDERHKFLPSLLSTLGYWPTVAVMGDGDLGFDSGDGICHMAPPSKDGSRRANLPPPHPPDFYRRGGFFLLIFPPLAVLSF